MSNECATPNAENCTLAELEVAMHATPSKRGFVRMQAMRWLLLGFDLETVAQLADKHPQTLLRWIERFNLRGIDGLIDRPRAGRPSKIATGHTEQLRALIQEPERVAVTHWTGKKFHGFLSHRLEEEIGYSTVMRWLKQHGFRLKVPRPWPDRQDEAAREAFCERLRRWLLDEEIDLWYMDEMGVEGDPRPRRRWALRGEKVRVTHNGDHLRMNVTGMVCPRTGEAFLLEFSHNDAAVFQAFLDEANRSVRKERRRNLLICDNASWHKVKSLRWGRFEPVYLPPYSPDLNPIERLWLVIKTEWFCDFIAKDRDALIARLDQALNWAIGRTEQNKITCAPKTKL